MSELDRDTVREMLNRNKSKIRDEFSVQDIAIFGSVARGAATGESDLDVMVSFTGKADSKKYFGLLFYLEDLFQCKINLVTERALRKELKPYVIKEAIHAWS